MNPTRTIPLALGKRIAVHVLSWVLAKALLRLGFLTNDDPDYAHLNRHVWAAAAAASTLECEHFCRLTRESVPIAREMLACTEGERRN